MCFLVTLLSSIGISSISIASKEGGRPRGTLTNWLSTRLILLPVVNGDSLKDFSVETFLDVTGYGGTISQSKAGLLVNAGETLFDLLRMSLAEVSALVNILLAIAIALSTRSADLPA